MSLSLSLGKQEKSPKSFLLTQHTLCLAFPSFKCIPTEGQSQIREGKKIVAESGSSVNITCIIDQTTSPPLFVYWYRNDNVLNYRQESVEDDEDHRRLRVYTTSSGPTTTISKLEIKGIVSTDAGNYSCRPVPQYTDPANITLHVLNGESTAAIQRNQRNALTSNTASIILLGFIIKTSFVSFTTWSSWCPCLCCLLLFIPSPPALIILIKHDRDFIKFLEFYPKHSCCKITSTHEVLYFVFD